MRRLLWLLADYTARAIVRRLDAIRTRYTEDE